MITPSDNHNRRRGKYRAFFMTTATAMTRGFDFMLITRNRAYDATFYDKISKEAIRGGLWRELGFWLCYPIKSQEGQQVAIKTRLVIKSRVVMTIKGVMMQNDAQNTIKTSAWRVRAEKTPKTPVLPLSIRASAKLKSTFRNPHGQKIGQGHCRECCIFAEKGLIFGFLCFFMLFY